MKSSAWPTITTNLFVGTGGSQGINESHFIGDVYGMERMMGRAHTPLRRILNYAQDHFCQRFRRCCSS